jgi:hypothetical protein
MRCGREPGHVRPDLGQNDRCGHRPNAGDLGEAFGCLQPVDKRRSPSSPIRYPSSGPRLGSVRIASSSSMLTPLI